MRDKRTTPCLPHETQLILAEFLEHMMEEGYHLINTTLDADKQLDELLSLYIGGYDTKNLLTEVKEDHRQRSQNRLSAGEHGE